MEEQLSALWQQVVGRYGEEVADLRREYEQLEQDFGARMTSYAQRVRNTWQAIQGELDVTTPDITGMVPQPQPGTELGAGLLNTEWDYFEQVEVYKMFQGRE